LRATIVRVPGPAILLIAAACSLATGCAFFEHLDSNGYSQVEAGAPDAQCNTDSGCLRIDCSDPNGNPCDVTQVCCLAFDKSLNLGGHCMNPSDCSPASGSIPLCSNNDLCSDGGSCRERFCGLPGATFVVRTCEPIQNCTTP
jgi:hypothetical protein